jgi:hypothetical protein
VAVKRRLGIVALVALACAAFAATALAKPTKQPPEPKLTVPRAELEAGYRCEGTVVSGGPQPLLFATGTSTSAEEGYILVHSAFEALGRPVCLVNFPDFTTADIQVSVQYLVYAIRREFSEAGKPIAIFGISQGGLLPRFALTYWPSLRPMVSDVLAAAGTQHGTTVTPGCSASFPCPPAAWQQIAGSRLLKALNSQPVEAPGPTSWTTVRSLSDETVQPQSGPHPTSALRGATNVLIQSICPGRTTSHIGTEVDSVTFAALVDAITHKGPAKISRFPADVCAHPYATGLNETTTNNLLNGSGGLLEAQLATVPLVPAEPKLRPYLTRPPAG